MLISGQHMRTYHICSCTYRGVIQIGRHDLEMPPSGLCHVCLPTPFHPRPWQELEVCFFAGRFEQQAAGEVVDIPVSTWQRAPCAAQWLTLSTARPWLSCGRPRASSRIPVQARAGTGASGADVTFLVGISALLVGRPVRATPHATPPID